MTTWCKILFWEIQKLHGWVGNPVRKPVLYPGAHVQDALNPRGSVVKDRKRSEKIVLQYYLFKCFKNSVFCSVILLSEVILNLLPLFSWFIYKVSLKFVQIFSKNFFFLNLLFEVDWIIHRVHTGSTYVWVLVAEKCRIVNYFC